MSVINSVVQGKKAYLFADRAITDGDGILIGTFSKFIKGANFPWAMTYSGHQIDQNEIVTRLSAHPCETPRKLAAALMSVLREMSVRTPDMSIGAHLAAWSSKLGRAALMLVANDSLHFPGLLPPFEIGEATHLIQGTRPAAEIMGREIDFCDPQSFNPLADGVTLMQAQRQTERFERSYETPAYRIGGGCEVAIVGRRGVQFRTLWEWPDKLGELIDPLATPGHPIAEKNACRR